MPDARGLLPDLTPAALRSDPEDPSSKLIYNGFESDHFSGSANCVSCHTNEDMRVSTETGERDVSIGTAWETSTMANAARDPYWHAVVAYELDRFPMHEEEIDDTCTRCHAPMANEYAKKEGLPLPHILDKGSEADGTFEPGLISRAADDPLFQHGADGVSCSLCHQIDPGNLGTEPGASMPESAQTGGWTVLDKRGGDLAERPAYGQYADDLISGYMSQKANFVPVYGAHMSRSETCATCHNLNVEPIDKDGVPLEGVDHFAEQANYTEWLFSDYAKEGNPLEQSCQDCHMPVLEQSVEIGEGAVEKRAGFREHTFLGANTVMQSMMRDFAEELGIEPGLDFDASIARNREFLQNESAEIEVLDLIQSTEADGERLAFDVRIVNKTGHKLPSGYHSRRVWLHVLVTDENGAQVFESGRMNADGSIVGVAEDINPNDWERHFDTITSPSQVQVYQAIVGNSDDERTQSLLNGSHYLKDNRLTPTGLLKKAVTGNPNLPDSFGVFGAAMDDDDFDSGLDNRRLPHRGTAGGSLHGQRRAPLPADLLRSPERAVPRVRPARRDRSVPHDLGGDDAEGGDPGDGDRRYRRLTGRTGRSSRNAPFATRSPRRRRETPTAPRIAPCTPLYSGSRLPCKCLIPEGAGVRPEPPACPALPSCRAVRSPPTAALRRPRRRGRPRSRAR